MFLLFRGLGGWFRKADGIVMSGLPHHVAVVVLGPYDQSPRMRYHARAMADAGMTVTMVAQAGTRDNPPKAANRQDGLWLLPVRRLPRSRPLFIFWAILRAILQTLDLAWAFVRIGPVQVILVQTPPPLPTLPIAWLAARLRGARLIVDWHNLSAPLLALRLGWDAPATRLTDFLERRAARLGDTHVCVSQAMAAWLARDFNLAATPFPDFPAAGFAAARETVATAAPLALLPPPLTGRPNADAQLLVAATSWTDDEDFGFLLEALDRHTNKAAPPESNGLHIVITGKGPLRSRFEADCHRRKWPGVAITCGWLGEEDYRDLIASADAGLCLHRSAAGIDLPMKALDYLGGGLPVLAYDYGPCLHELLRPGENAVLFTTTVELGDWLTGLRAGHNDTLVQLAELRGNIAARPLPTWEAAWRQVMPALLRQTMRNPDL